MKNYIYIGLGGAMGSLARVLLEQIHIYHYHELVPMNTLLINVSGSFLLALILTLAFEVWEMDESLRLGITTGFLGGYTTFSTLCKETVGLMNGGNYFSALTYITMSTILGLVFAYLGVILAREWLARLIKRKDASSDHTDVDGNADEDALA